MSLLYSLIYVLASLIMLPYEYLKRPKDIRSMWLRERFGMSSARDERPCIWVHAVSVGEVNASVPLVSRMLKEMPLYKIMFTTVTDTGRSVAMRLFKDKIDIRYAPFDIPSIIQKTIETSSVSLLVIMETELWPNTIGTANKLSIPVVLINGRISERSFRGYCRIRRFMGKVLRGMSYICVQNEIYRERFLSLGADPERTIIMGNLKFDVSIDATIPEWTKRLKGKIVVAGSTHGSEEEIIIEAFERCLKDHPDTILVIAPRHPQRFSDVEDLLLRKSLPYVKRGDLDRDHAVVDFRYMLLNSVGELASVYGACDIAIIGGSFIPHGGQNPLEPAYWARPIICGPHMDNFYFIDELCKAGAAVMTDAAGLSDVLNRFLSDAALASMTGQIARSFVEDNRGAAEKAMTFVKTCLS